MIHLGDITKINGAEIPKVDVITGGSPCQDLSVAGKRAGLDGERSGLFMEQIRIIKEMREDDRKTGRADELVRPRFMVWENVPGALSSGKPKGEDFRIVLEETARVADQTATVPRSKDGKWSNSGTILGDGFSISWRVHDAQFWGVPQRRRRISLVADFNGHRSAEILFERKSVSRDSEESKETWERVAKSAERSVGETSESIYALEGNGVRKSHNDPGFSDGNVMYTLNSVEQHAVAIGVPLENHPNDSRIKIRKDGIFQSLSGRMGTGGNNTPLVFCFSSMVRRLTPLECERLQGFLDGWTDIGEWIDSKGKKHKDADSPRYKALGNSIALPFWEWLAKRICAEYDHPITMGSLFDGIGGFPLAFERAGAKAVWASEIEEFCIAVTKLRFSEGDETNEPNE